MSAALADEASGQELLVCDLGELRVGFASRSVREVVRSVRILPLPGAAGSVEGAINVRGELAAIVDVRARLGLPAKPVALTDHLVLVSDGERLLGFRVDRAVGLVVVPGERIRPAGELLSSPGLVEGVAKLPDGLLVIHDLFSFLDDAEKAGIDAALLASRSGARR